VTYQLRDYQRQAVDGLWRYFETKTGNPLVVLPTGSGKSLVQAAFIQEVRERYPSERILVLSHVKEIVLQNARKLDALLPPGTVGVYSAGLGSRDLGFPVTVAGIQSVAHRADDLGPIDLVIVDEAHLVPPSGEGRYRTLLGILTERNPHLKVIGLSATPYRLKSGLLHRGEGRLFTDIAVDVPVGELIAKGYLSPLRSKGGHARADVSGVKTRGGEFVKGELERAVNHGELIEAALDEVERFAHDRRSWIVFCAGVAHAKAVTLSLQRRGISAACVTGKTKRRERDLVLERFKAGRLRAVVNVDVLTIGFDAPGVDCVVMLRPTQSAGLYVQMLGRGMRIAPGKADCLVLDFAGNVERHGPVDDVQVTDGPKRKGAGTAPVKLCPECDEYVRAAARECVCGYLFAVDARPPHESQASRAAVLKADRKPEEVLVDGVRFKVHRKPGKPPSLRVEYQCGLAVYREWICLEHQGFAKRKAHAWWKRMAKSDPPASVDEAIARSGEVAKPSAILVAKDGKYMRVSGYQFAPVAEAAE